MQGISDRVKAEHTPQKTVMSFTFIGHNSIRKHIYNWTVAIEAGIRTTLCGRAVRPVVHSADTLMKAPVCAQCLKALERRLGDEVTAGQGDPASKNFLGTGAKSILNKVPWYLHEKIQSWQEILYATAHLQEEYYKSEESSRVSDIDEDDLQNFLKYVEDNCDLSSAYAEKLTRVYTHLHKQGAFNLDILREMVKCPESLVMGGRVYHCNKIRGHSRSHQASTRMSSNDVDISWG